MYTVVMLATPELIRETSQLARLEELLPRWRDVPLYRRSLAHAPFDFNRLPLIAKREMRTDFPRNFLPENQSLETLLEKNVVDLKHTSAPREKALPGTFA